MPCCIFYNFSRQFAGGSDLARTLPFEKNFSLFNFNRLIYIEVGHELFNLYFMYFEAYVLAFVLQTFHFDINVLDRNDIPGLQLYMICKCEVSNSC